MASSSSFARALGKKRRVDTQSVAEVVTLDSEEDDDIKFLSASNRKRPRDQRDDEKENSVLFSSRGLKLLTPSDYRKEVRKHLDGKAKLGLDSLPNEVIAEILGNVSSQDDLLNCRLVSRDWNALSCLKLRNTHTPIEFERMKELKYFINVMHHKIPGQRVPYTRFALNLDKPSTRALELFVTQPGLDIKHLTLLTEGKKGRKSKGKLRQEDFDPLKFILGKLQGLKHLTIAFHKNVSGDIALVESYAQVIQHLPSVGLINVTLSPNLVSEFGLLTRLQPLRLTTLGIEFRKVPGTLSDDLLDLFHNWLEEHASTLVDLSINSCLVGVQLPTLPKLQRLCLGIDSMEKRRMYTFDNILPSQFPSLVQVSLNSFLVKKATVKYDSANGAFREEVFPTVKALDLCHIFPESSFTYSFPNLEKLRLGPNVVKHILLDVFTHYGDIKHLTLTLSPMTWDWWDAFTGGAKRRRRESLAAPAVVDLERDFVLWGPRRSCVYLGLLAELKTLKLESCPVDVVDALVYLTANGFIPRLDKLSVTFLEPYDYPAKLLTVLHNYHGKVTISSTVYNGV